MRPSHVRCTPWPAAHLKASRRPCAAAGGSAPSTLPHQQPAPDQAVRLLPMAVLERQQPVPRVHPAAIVLRLSWKLSVVS